MVRSIFSISSVTADQQSPAACRCSIKQGVFANSKFRGKHLCQNFLINKVAGCSLQIHWKSDSETGAFFRIMTLITVLITLTTCLQQGSTMHLYRKDMAEPCYIKGIQKQPFSRRSEEQCEDYRTVDQQCVLSYYPQ